MDGMATRFDRALHQTSRAWRLALGRRLKSRGLSQAAWQTVAMVGAATAPMSQARLAQLLGVEGATITAMLDRLARDGVLRRVACDEDRRIKLVLLTADGERLFQQIRIEAEAVRMALISGLDKDALLAATEMLEGLQQSLLSRADHG